MTYPEPIHIEGLASFSRNLRKLDAEAPKQLRLVFNDAAQLVVAGTRQKFPRRTGRAAGTVKARSTRTAARVSEGSERVSYVPWLDFGGRVGRARSITRPFLPQGRYLYKTYYDLRDRGGIESALEAGLSKVVSDAGLEG